MAILLRKERLLEMDGGDIGESQHDMASRDLYISAKMKGREGAMREVRHRRWPIRLTKRVVKSPRRRDTVSNYVEPMTPSCC